MANELAHFRTPPMTLSLAQKVSSAKQILAQPSSPSLASRFARQLVGSYAHLRPDNPEVFIASIAAVLAQYPLGVVEEAADPRKGIARTVEFLSVRALVEWCDARLAFYQGLASYVGGAPKLVECPQLTDEELARGSDAMRGLFIALREKRDLSGMTFEDAIALGREQPADKEAPAA